RRMPRDDDVQLLLAAVAVRLVVLLDNDPGLDPDVGVDPKRADVEVAADRVPVVAVPRAQALDVLDPCDPVAHRTSSAKRGSSRSAAKSSSSRAPPRRPGSTSSAARRCSTASS